MITGITSVFIVTFLLPHDFWILGVYSKSMDTESMTCDFAGTVADPGDCTAYYHCAGGTLYHYRCGAASVFDEDLFSCVSPAEKHHCDKAKALPLTQNRDGSFVCQYDGYFPDPTDCRRFYRCSGSTMHAFSCPKGLGFDPDKITCHPIEEILQCGLEGFLTSRNKVKKVKDLMLRELSRGLGKVNTQGSFFKESPKLHINTDDSEYSYTTRDSFYDNKPNDRHRQSAFEDNRKSERKHSATLNHEPISVENTFLHEPIKTEDTYPWVEEEYYTNQPELENNGFESWNRYNSETLYPNPPVTSPKRVFPWRNPSYKESPQLNTRRPHTTNAYVREKPRRRRLRMDSNREDNEPYLYTAPPLSDKHLRKTKPNQIRDAGSEERSFTPTPEVYLNFNNKYGKQGVSYEDYNTDRNSQNAQPNLNMAKPFHCPYDGYFRDDDDCTRFFHCTHGIPYLVKCNGGLFFNPTNKICDWPARVSECSQGMRKVFVSPKHMRLDDWRLVGIGETKGSELTDSKMANSAKESRAAQDDNVLDDDKNATQNQCEGEGYVRDVEDCSKFFYCSTENERTQYSCGNEMAFNSDLQACVPFQYVFDCR